MRKYIGSFEKQIILRFALGKPLMILIDLLFITGGSLPTQKHGCDDAAEPNMIFFQGSPFISLNGFIPRWFNQYIHF